MAAIEDVKLHRPSSGKQAGFDPSGLKSSSGSLRPNGMLPVCKRPTLLRKVRSVAGTLAGGVHDHVAVGGARRGEHHLRAPVEDCVHEEGLVLFVRRLGLFACRACLACQTCPCVHCVTALRWSMLFPPPFPEGAPNRRRPGSSALFAVTVSVSSSAASASTSSRRLRPRRVRPLPRRRLLPRRRGPQ